MQLLRCQVGELRRHVRLVVKDIEAGGRDRAVLQRGDQIVLVDARAAADIDEDAVRAESFEDFRREDPVRRRRSRHYRDQRVDSRSEEHTSELQSLMRISYAVFCLKKKNTNI